MSITKSGYPSSQLCGLKLLVLLSVAIALSGCQIQKLKSDLEVAKQEYGVLTIETLPTTILTDNKKRVYVAVYRGNGDSREMVNFRTTAAGQRQYMIMPMGQYELLAFVDSNDDLIYQPGEPIFWQKTIAPIALSSLDEQDSSLQELDALKLQLEPNQTFKQNLDVSMFGLKRQLAQAKDKFLHQVDWQDPRFSQQVAQLGMWQPVAFSEQFGFGLYTLDKFEPNKPSVVFVHGISGSPAQFEQIAEHLAKDVQVLLFQYPSAYPLDYSAYILQVALEEVVNLYQPSSLAVVAHSMGGLVARGALVASDNLNSHSIKFITMATPWSGHFAASYGVAYSPVVAPVWRSMVPESQYLKQIFATELSTYHQHYLLFAYAKSRGGEGSANDGSVSLKSQLNEQAQREARKVIGVSDDHTGVLTNSLVYQYINQWLFD
ncbi:putative lipase [Shewanella sp. WXL01]|uniref:lipase family alpha/beta hydrolase n=1 Tax=Shewanella sp. WXL01 TaxID=2709721 RepID=UPI00143848A3|nr:alpha/beta fold hydrolase [Shewanella sp. WXL01]NKF50254.1 putative lipase [Shewanella sp. WXL01]